MTPGPSQRKQRTGYEKGTSRGGVGPGKEKGGFGIGKDALYPTGPKGGRMGGKVLKEFEKGRSTRK